LEPFDEALGEDESYIADSATVTMVWGPHHEYSLTLGDLRKARAALGDDQ